MRADFFGAMADTRWNQKSLLAATELSTIMNSTSATVALAKCLQALQPEFVVNTAAQPSHDPAAALGL